MGFEYYPPGTLKPVEFMFFTDASEPRLAPDYVRQFASGDQVVTVLLLQENGIGFYSVAQYVAYKRAQFFGKDDVAEQVFRTVECDVVRELVSGLTSDAWTQRLPAVLTEANRLKFSGPGNADLYASLRAAGGARSTEASQFVYDSTDAVLGTGERKGLAWTGQNLHGLALTAARKACRVEG